MQGCPGGKGCLGDAGAGMSGGKGCPGDAGAGMSVCRRLQQRPRGRKTAGPGFVYLVVMLLPPPYGAVVACDSCVVGGLVVGAFVVAFVICSVVFSTTELAVVSSAESPVLVRDVLE